MPWNVKLRRPGRPCAALGAVILITACAERQAEPPAPRPVAWTEVQTYSGEEVRRLPGLVRAAQRAPLSFEVPGRVVEVNVEIGERFEKDDILAELDTRSLRLTLAERRANLADARARWSEARKTLERKKELRERGFSNQAVLDNAESAHASARAQTQRLQALVDLAREDLADARLNAPYAGEILQRAVEPSQQIRAGETVFRIQGAAGGLEIILNAPETVVDRLVRGMRAEIGFPARPDVRATGTVTEIGAGAVARSAYPVTLTLDEPPEQIRPGMTAEAALPLTGTPGAPANGRVVIPITAFLAAEDQSNVAFVFDPDSQTVNRRAIRLADVGSDRAIVAEGLKPGELVATKGLAFLKDGDKVTRLGVGTQRYQP